MRVIVAEKDNLAHAIVKALPRKPVYRDYHVICGDDVVCWAQGHLYEFATPEYYDPRFKQWRADYLPIIPARFKLLPVEHTAHLLATIERLCKQAVSIVNACDPDREGQWIFDQIIEAIGGLGTKAVLPLHTSPKMEGFESTRPRTKGGASIPFRPNPGNVTVFQRVRHATRILLSGPSKGGCKDVFDWVKSLVATINSVHTQFAKIPQDARTAFDNVLTELIATYSGIDAALASLSALSFDSPVRQSAAEVILQNVTTGRLKRDLEAAKYSCDRLDATYATHLETYLKAPGVIPKQRRDDLIAAFSELRHGDLAFLKRIEEIESEYRVLSAELLALAPDSAKMTQAYGPMKQRLLQQHRQLSDELVEMMRARRALNASLVTRFGPDLQTVTVIAIGIVLLLGVAGAWAWRAGFFTKHGDWYVVRTFVGRSEATVAGPFSSGDACRVEIVHASDLGATTSNLHCVFSSKAAP